MASSSLLTSGLACALAVTACGDEGASTTSGGNENPPHCQAGEIERDDGSCQPAGLPPPGSCAAGEIEHEAGCCPAGTVTPDCSDPGVPPDMCGTGFQSDGARGCVPILPSSPCGLGLMALPGEMECRALADCGTTTWGSIPVESNTIYVDVSFTGGVSNGSPSAPFTSIGQAMLAAEAGAIIAIAAGLYTEQIPDIEKPLRFWGRCPDLVTLKPGVGTVVINVWSEQAIGTEIHTLQIDGGGFGVRNIAAEGVLVDRVWVHDTDYHGFRVHGWNGSTDNASLTIRGSLVEGSGYLGINSAGNDIVIEDTVVRNSSGAGDGGIVLQAYPFPNGLTGVPDATIRRVLVEQTKRVGMLFYGARALVEDSLVRDIEPIDGMGRGIEADYLAIASPQVMMASELTLRRSVIENATEVGVLAGGSTATLQHVVVRGTRPSPVSGHASAVHAQPHEGAPPMLTMDASLVTDTVGTSVVLASGVVAIDKSIIVDSRGVAGNTYGVGVLTTSLDVDDPPGTLTVTQSRVVRSDDVGIALYDRDASIHGTLIDDTRILSGDLGGTGVLTSFHAPNDPNVAVISSVIRRSRGIGVRASGANISMTATLLDNELLAPGFLASYGTHRLTRSVIANTSAYGVSLEGGDLEMQGLLVRDVDRGPAIQLFATTEGGSHFVLRESALVRARSQALLAVESQGTVEATVIDGVTPGLDGYFGDGITVMGGAHPASVAVRGSVIGNTTRAGIANFGAHLGLRAVALQCSSFFLNGERFGDLDYIYEDLGGNSCACNGVLAACKVISSSPEVPAPSAPVTPDGTIPVGGVDPNEPGS